MFSHWRVEVAANALDSNEAQQQVNGKNKGGTSGGWDMLRDSSRHYTLLAAPSQPHVSVPLQLWKPEDSLEFPTFHTRISVVRGSRNRQLPCQTFFSVEIAMTDFPEFPDSQNTNLGTSEPEVS